MSWFSVDTETLGALAARMARTRDEVAAAAGVAHGCAAGSAGLVAGALADFDDHWHYGLKRIVGNVDACQQALAAAAAGYEQVEGAIARAASGG